MSPLVSILIPAYNAERWISDTIRSALAQTWTRKEIIVVDDGSRDETLAIAQRFASCDVLVVTQENQGAATARNRAFQVCQGDYIQWLDADDLLSPDKIAKQMAALECEGKRMLMSCSWSYFSYSPERARFEPSPLWSDLAPVEWLTRKIGQNLQMPPATWLVSRELTQAAGPWDSRLSFDDDGEYFCRVVRASDGVRFVPEAKVFYRLSGSDSLSSMDESEQKLDSLFLSMQLHISHVRSLEDSERVRAACLSYLQKRLIRFYPENAALVEQLQEMATRLGGRLEVPYLPPRYAWMRKMFGWRFTKRFRRRYNRTKALVTRAVDNVLFRLTRGTIAQTNSGFNATSAIPSSRS